MRILHVVGARPNFMKIAPIMRAMAVRQEFEQRLVHTGQHYDDAMSKTFFDELELPRPDVHLEVGSGSHAVQTAAVLTRIEPVIGDYQPDWVVVPGDVNSTLAAALAAAKLGVRVAHVEAGLRSFDRSMPEEINRILTDQIADLLFTPSRDADEHLSREGIARDKIRFVGNVMIDTLVALLPKALERWPAMSHRFGVREPFMLVTLHRPGNVDRPDRLTEIVGALQDIGAMLPVIFPVHPRTQRQLHGGAFARAPGVRMIDPLGYLDFLALEAHAALVLTDSGGVQEETTFLGVPCLTARANTERPVTVIQGTNRLVAVERGALVGAARAALDAPSTVRRDPPPLWDGRTASRIVTGFLEAPLQS